MASKLHYPSIMMPGQLKDLNDYVISRLGTPIFFSTPEPARPRAQSATGLLYEIITGLYLIYRDYGMRILKTYLDFCRKHFNENTRVVCAHYNSVNQLRGGFCHGSLLGGSQAMALIRTMGYYLPTDYDKEWPEFMATLNEEQCKEIDNKLADSSERMVKYIKTCADQISLDEDLLVLWRKTLVENALNKDTRKYGKDNQYFDGRIVRDLENNVKRGHPSKPHQQALKRWLIELEPLLLRGEIADSDELRRTLVQALENLYHPTEMQTNKSSADILMEDIVI